MNADHPVIQTIVAPHVEQYAPHLSEDVEREVLEVYVQVAVAKVAHTQFLRRVMSEDDVELLRSPISLTTALLGLLSEEAIIGQRLGKFGTKRKTA